MRDVLLARFHLPERLPRALARHALRGKPGIDLSKRGVDLRPLGEQSFLGGSVTELRVQRCKLLQLVKLLDRAAQLRDLRAQSV